MAIKVFNADDHPILRKGIVDLIVETDGFDWVGSADNGSEAWDKIQSFHPDIALLDIEMPGYSGIEICRLIQESELNTRVVVLTLFKDAGFIRQALDAGVHGYLLKESRESEIIDCLRSVAEGRKYVSPALTQTLMDLNKEEANVLEGITEHEKNILKLIARNKTTNEIAEMLFLSAKTISNHRTNISKKLKLDGQQNALLKWVLENKELFD